MPGICASSRSSETGSPCSFARLKAARAVHPLSARLGLHPPLAQRSFQNAAVGRVVVDHQTRGFLRVSAGDSRSLRLDRFLRQLEQSGEMKRASLPRFALHPYPPAHHFHEPRRNRQSQTRSRRTFAARNYPPARTLRKSASACLWKFRCPNPESQNAAKCPGSFCSVVSTCRTTSPRSVNLIAFPSRFTITCRRRVGSPTTSMRHIGPDVAHEFQSFGGSAHRERPRRFLQVIAQAECRGVEFQLSRLDLREVQDVVDHRQQRIRRRLHHAQVFVLFRRQLRFQRKLRHADDSVHRGADFVAHVGQEFAFGAAGGFRGFFGLLQFRFRLLALGDVEQRSFDQIPGAPLLPE